MKNEQEQQGSKEVRNLPRRQEVPGIQKENPITPAPIWPLQLHHLE